jgi:hypothetical protein
MDTDDGSERGGWRVETVSPELRRPCPSFDVEDCNGGDPTDDIESGLDRGAERLL